MARRHGAGWVVGVALLAAACSGSGEGTSSGDETTVTTASSPPTTTTTTVAGVDDGSDSEERAVDASAVTESPPIDRWPSDLATLDPTRPARWTIDVLATAPHDPEAFTQGLEELADGRLLESTGIRGVSDLRIVDPDSGEVVDSVPLEPDEFGEGVTVVGDTAVQLTWEKGVARRWSLPSLEPLDSFSYQGLGWGLCRLDDRLAMTDGSSTLTWRDPESFAIVETVTVRQAGAPVSSLNELECVDGHVIANVLPSSDILVIRPDGDVVAVIDASVLAATIASDDPRREALNGIAALADGTITLTGKLWPTRFVVTIVAA